MKTILTTLIVGIFSLSSMATVHTVSNNPGSPGEYNNLQTAIDAATNGDTSVRAWVTHKLWQHLSQPQPNTHWNRL
jgi:hypothetical protein